MPDDVALGRLGSQGLAVFPVLERGGSAPTEGTWRHPGKDLLWVGQKGTHVPSLQAPAGLGRGGHSEASGPSPTQARRRPQGPGPL